MDSKQIDEVIAKFPEEFGLANFPGKKFRISRYDSYYSNDFGLQLYTHMLCEDGKWRAFAKGTVAELQRELVKL